MDRNSGRKTDLVSFNKLVHPPIHYDCFVHVIQVIHACYYWQIELDSRLGTDLARIAVGCPYSEKDEVKRL